MRTKRSFLFLALCAAIAGDAAARGPNVTCESYDGARIFCRVQGDGRVWVDAQLSRTPCIEGENWERTSTGIVVDKGCRAIFGTGGGEPESRDDSGFADLAGQPSKTAKRTLLDRGYTHARSSYAYFLHVYFYSPDRRSCIEALSRDDVYHSLSVVAWDQCMAPASPH
jgi:hypothetical protein